MLSAGTAHSEDIKIGLNIYSFEDMFLKRYRDALTFEAWKHGVKFFAADANKSQRKQNNQVSEFIATHVNALIISPVDRNDVGDLINRAKRAFIPLVFINREPPKEFLDQYKKSWYVGSDTSGAGTIAGGILADYFKNHPEADKNHDGKTQYVILKGEKSHQDTQIVTERTLKALTDAGFELDELAGDYADWQKFKAVVKMQGFIYLARGVENIEAIIANNDEMALGALMAIKIHKYNSGDPEKFIPIVGIDGNTEALEAISKNEIIGTVLNDAETQAAAAMSIAVEASKGHEINEENIGFNIIDGKYIRVPCKKITHENYKEFLK